MSYEISEEAKSNPRLMRSPIYEEWIGVGAEFVEKPQGGCATCGNEVTVQEPRKFREATKEEYEKLAELYQASNGIPYVLRIVNSKTK